MTLRTSTTHIGLGNPLYEEFSLLTRQSNDLYNTVNYLMRQVFIPFSKNKRSPTYFRPETLDLIFTLNEEIENYNAERLTSKASCLSLDTLPKYGDKVDKTAFSGIRKKEHYTDKKYNITYNSDINGSYNIGRKHNKHYCPNWGELSGAERQKLLTPEIVPLHALGKSRITALTQGLRGYQPLTREQN